MRTLSIRQPWAWLILRPDLTDPAARAKALASKQMKRVENRDWTTAYRGRFLIHAGSQMVKRDFWETADYLRTELGIELPHPVELQLGGIVGAATLVEVVTELDDPFFVGPHGWLLEDARPLPFVPFKGQLGWFNVPREVVMKGVQGGGDEPKA